MDNISSALQGVGDAFSGGAADAGGQAATDAASFDAGSLGTGGGTLATGGAGAADAAGDAAGFVNAGPGIANVLQTGAGGPTTGTGSGSLEALTGSSGVASPGPTAAAVPAGVSGGPGASAAAIAAPNPNSSGGGILDFLKKNPAVVGAGAIGANALLGQQSIPNLGNLTAAGNNAAGVAGLSNTLQTGQLPPGAQQLITNATNDAIAGIKSRYASLGLSGSSMEAQDIQAAQERASAQTFEIANQITQEGLSAAGLEDQIFSNIANLQLNQDKGLQDAISQFAGSAGLGAGLQALKQQTAA